jgi:hypothetical protein
MFSFKILFIFLLCIFVCNCQEQLNPNCETLGETDYCYCNNDTACSNEQISCLYRTCRIFCNGENSCQNLNVYVEKHIGFVLGCRGLNACINIWVLGPMFDNNPIEPEPTQIIINPPNVLSTGATLGIFFGLFFGIILFVIGIFMYRHCQQTNNKLFF